MEKKFLLTLDKEFIEYCELNNIEDITKLASRVFQNGFTLLKYGKSPPLETISNVLKKAKETAQIDPVFAKEIVDNAQIAIDGYRKDHELLYGE